jgi:hypothetical protein
MRGTRGTTMVLDFVGSACCCGAGACGAGTGPGIGLRDLFTGGFSSISGIIQLLSYEKKKEKKSYEKKEAHSQGGVIITDQ